VYAEYAHENKNKRKKAGSWIQHLNTQ
jgi:hypothetical protein